MFLRTVIPGKIDHRQGTYFGSPPSEWREYPSKVAARWVSTSDEHPTMPRVFVDPSGLHFSVHKSKGSIAMTRTEVYENE